MDELDRIMNLTDNSVFGDTGYTVSQDDGYSSIFTTISSLTSSSSSSSSPSAANATAPRSVNLNKNIIIPAGMFFIGVLGNVTALIILSVRPSKVSRSTAFYHLVKALAVIDLLGIVVLSPVTIAVYIKGGVLKTGGMPLCHYFSAGLLMASTSTLFIVLIMAAERLLVTKYPFHYGEIVTHKRVNIIIAVIVLLSAFGAILPIIGLGHNTAPWPGTWCFFDYRSTDVGSYVYSILYSAVGLLVLVVTFGFNATVIKHLWHMRKTRLHTSSLRNSTRAEKAFPGKQSESPDSEKRMVIFLMAITIVFTVCYAPFMVRVFWNQIWNAGRDITPEGVDDKLDLWVLRMASLNQLLDPWVYIISRFTCCSGPRERSQPSNITNHPSQRHQAGNGNSVREDAEHDTKRFGKSLRTVRNMFRQSKSSTTKQNENAMEPLHSSPATSSSPLKQSPEKSKAIYTSKESEREVLCRQDVVHQPV